MYVLAAASAFASLLLFNTVAGPVTCKLLTVSRRSAAATSLAKSVRMKCIPAGNGMAGVE